MWDPAVVQCGQDTGALRKAIGSNPESPLPFKLIQAKS